MSRPNWTTANRRQLFTTGLIVAATILLWGFAKSGSVGAAPFIDCPGSGSVILTATPADAAALTNSLASYTCDDHMRPTTSQARVDGYQDAQVVCPGGSSHVPIGGPTPIVTIGCRTSSGTYAAPTSFRRNFPPSDAPAPAGPGAKCYIVDSAATPPTVTGADCTVAPFPTYGLFNEPDGILRSNHCYILGIGPVIIAAPLTNVFCTNAQTNSGDSADPGDATDIFGTSRTELQRCSGAQCVNNNPITKLAILAINILSALVGIIVVGVIVMAGIQYSSSGGNPQQTADAKKHIINAIIALIAFFFMYAAFQWLIPGGVFR